MKWSNICVCSFCCKITEHIPKRGQLFNVDNVSPIPDPNKLCKGLLGVDDVAEGGMNDVFFSQPSTSSSVTER